MSEQRKKRLGDLLIEKGKITQRELNIALSVQKITGKRLGETLVELGFVTARDISELLAEQFGMEFLDLQLFPPQEEALKLIPRRVAEEYKILPVYLENGSLVLGVTDPADIRGLDVARRLTGKLVRPKVVDAQSFNDALEKPTTL